MRLLTTTRCNLLSVLLIAVSFVPIKSFTDKLVFRRQLPPDVTPSQAYARCLQAWRVDNLGLPWFLVSPPFILEWGDEDTGVGFVLARVPPLFLKEGIVHHSVELDNTNNTMLVMQYKVCNPGYLTWPVKNHLGTIIFRHPTMQNEQMEQDSNTVVVVAVGCEIEWTIEWTPLWMPIPYWRKVLAWVHGLVIETAINHIAKALEGSSTTTTTTSTTTTRTSRLQSEL